jgi:protein required for attachment to host cells
MRAVVTLVVIASEDKARFLENPGVGKGLIEVEDVMRSAAEAELVENSDRPGRVVSSGGLLHTYEPRTKPEDRLRQLFAEDIVKAVAARDSDAPFARLVMSAPPRMLGLLRAALTPELRRKLVFDLDKDLIAVAAADLPAYFTREATF